MSATITERLIASRDDLKKLDISEYAMIREAREAMAEAANALDNYGKTMDRILEIDQRIVGVLDWLNERGRNSTSYGSHADAYEIAARRLHQALDPSHDQ